MKRLQAGPIVVVVVVLVEARIELIARRVD